MEWPFDKQASKDPVFVALTVSRHTLLKGVNYTKKDHLKSGNICNPDFFRLVCEWLKKQMVSKCY